MKFIRATCRVEFVSPPETERAFANGSVAFALWHEHLFAGIMVHGNRNLAPLASLSRDGDVVTNVLDAMGYHVIRGSSSRGGEEARDQLIEVTQLSLNPTITVDGPRGPRRIVKGGIVDVARRTGIPVVTMAPIANRNLIMSRSWDRFRIPLPFSRVTVTYGQPIHVPPETRGLAFGETKQKIKESLQSSEK